jgi:hypothetical protein
MSEEKGKAEKEQAEKGSEKAGLKMPQVLAAALAAVTAALLGSTMGVTGTVLGAGVASIVTTVGSELYLRSLNRTREAAARTRELARQRAAMKMDRTAVLPQARQVPGQHTAAYRGTRRTEVFQPVPVGEQDLTRHLPVTGDGRSGGGERTVFIPRPGAQAPAGEAPPPRLRRRRLRWPLIAATSLLAFVIGMLVLTGFEQVTGRAISGGSGNTVSRFVGGGDSGAEQQDEQRQIPRQQDEQGQNDEQAPATTTVPDEPVESSVPSSENPVEPSEPSGPSSGQEQSSEVDTPTSEAVAPSSEVDAPAG